MMQEAATRPVRVVVVDDSRLMRRMIVSGLQSDEGIEVIGEAGDTAEARQLIRSLDPDVITLDVEMPGMNGIDFLRKIMELRPMPVIMVSTLTAAGTDVSLAALQLGAVDAIQKPSGREQVAPFGRALRDKVHLASAARIRGRAQPALDALRLATPQGPVPVPGRRPVRRPELIAVGASTGGVSALTQLLEGLPPATPPIVITQHMPPNFTSRFASRLNNLLSQDIAEARDGEVLGPGQIRIAPGDSHLCVVRTGGRLLTRLDDAGPISGHKPSVDVLFNSVSTAAAGGAVGVILTGMGRDGAAGLRAMRRAGAYCLGQAEESCVVYGMPRAAREIEAIDEELDLPQMAQRICEILNPGAAIKHA